MKDCHTYDEIHTLINRWEVPLQHPLCTHCRRTQQILEWFLDKRSLSTVSLRIGNRAEPGQTEPKPCEVEIASAKWMPLSEFLSNPFMRGRPLYSKVWDASLCTMSAPSRPGIIMQLRVRLEMLERYLNAIPVPFHFHPSPLCFCSCVSGLAVFCMLLVPRCHDRVP